MSYAPATLVELGRLYVEHGGVNLGIVGDDEHTIGYHLGRDRIFDGSGPGVGSSDYSVQHERDAAGLTDAAAAIDFGRLNGELDELYRFSRWLVAECQRGAPGSGDVREVIYSPDGRTVQRWSGIDGAIHTGPGNGNASHIGHTHVSYFRDSERRDKRPLIAGYWEDEMPGVMWYPMAGGDGVVKLKAGRGLIDLVTGRRYVPADTEKQSHCRGRIDDVGDGYVVRDAGHACLALDDAVTFTPASSPATPTVHYTLTLDGVTVAEGVHPSP